MTEDEAKTKACHKTLTPVASADGSAPWFTSQTCIGSACMAWRWDGGFPLPNDPPAISERYNGFCGLAGKP